jgi:hypothetical protein
MKQVLLAAVAVVALTGAAQASTKHKWYMVNYAEGTCGPAPGNGTPEEMYQALLILSPRIGGPMPNRISPDDVTKDPNGIIHVHMTGKAANGDDAYWDFFTDIKACQVYMSDNGITPQEAPNSDIN